MGDPSAVNTAAGVVNGIIDAINKGGVTAAEVFITGLNPAVLGEPIIAFFIDKGVAWLASIIEEVEIKDATAIVVDIQTNGEQSAVVQAGAALAFANASGDKDAIANARDQLIDAYADLVHFDGVAPPH